MQGREAQIQYFAKREIIFFQTKCKSSLVILQLIQKNILDGLFTNKPILLKDLGVF